MPEEMETREVDGKEEIYFGGEWQPVKEQKQKTKKEYPISVEVKIGNKSLKAKGRANIFKWKDKRGKEHDRKAYAIKIDEGQPAYGGGNIFVRA